MAVDYTSHGNYMIQSCGAKAPQVGSILDQLAADIRLEFRSKGTTAAYRAFFGNDYLDPIEIIFRQIQYGTSYTTGHHTYRPTIICSNTVDQYVWDFCELGHYAAWGGNTQLILLCPSFWTRPQYPTGDHCGTAHEASPDEFAQSQYAILVHELTHLYLKKPCLLPEVYRPIDCLALPADQAVRNPQSYTLFLASE